MRPEEGEIGSLKCAPEPPSSQGTKGRGHWRTQVSTSYILRGERAGAMAGAEGRRVGARKPSGKRQHLPHPAFHPGQRLPRWHLQVRPGMCSRRIWHLAFLGFPAVRTPPCSPTGSLDALSSLYCSALRTPSPSPCAHGCGPPVSTGGRRGPLGAGLHGRFSRLWANLETPGGDMGLAARLCRRESGPRDASSSPASRTAPRPARSQARFTADDAHGGAPSEMEQMAERRAGP